MKKLNVYFQFIAVSGSILTDYEECVKKNGFGDNELVCDPDNLLLNSTKEHLRSLLAVLQEKVHCECAQGCHRDNGNDKLVELSFLILVLPAIMLIVLDSDNADTDAIATDHNDISYFQW